ncbi:MAG: 16S rRNA (cytidine(1402)-2'-O)-methyltransferase, partial [Nitrospirae bacterium]|nr:16S rRNA (cytidine(1402)-2'-O)-methyltransferase [Nitrospirota bacterium]
MDKDRPGELFVVSTPIGNLEDITFRAVRILNETDIIAAEDTRVTRVLLAHHGIRTPTVSYHAHNATEKAPLLVSRMREGQSVALVSDAGTPLLSDPGEVLVRAAVDAGITVRPVPGASALLSGLVVSGLDTSRFAFHGFLPRKESECRLTIRSLSRYPETLVFYESPRRVDKTIALLAEELGDRPAVLARELTKIFESVKRGTLFTFRDRGTGEPEKGEWVLMVGGC